MRSFTFGAFNLDWLSFVSHGWFLLLLDLLSQSGGENKEETNEEFTRKEFGYASFRRSFILPETVDGDKIKANYNDGILNVTLPKKEEAKPKPARTIKIS